MDRIIAAEVFIAIVECGSLVRAADMMNMSRPMVSRYLVEMETWANARLLHRTTRKLGLTPAGEITLRHCQRILAEAKAMHSVADLETNEPRGALRITCSQSLGQAVLAPAVTEYLRRYPRTTIELRLSNEKINLVEERIDLAVRIAHQLDPGLIARPLGTCQSVVCASPGYLQANGHPRRPEELSRHNCLQYTPMGKGAWTFEQHGPALNVPVAGNLSADEMAPLQYAAVGDMGIAILPLFSAAPLIAAGRLVHLLPQYKPQDMGIYAVYMSREHLSATLRTMVDFLHEWFEPACRLAPTERRNRLERCAGPSER